MCSTFFVQERHHTVRKPVQERHHKLNFISRFYGIRVQYLQMKNYPGSVPPCALSGLHHSGPYTILAGEESRREFSLISNRGGESFVCLVTKRRSFIVKERRVGPYANKG